MAKLKEQLKIGILGPGGIGGLLAGLFCKSGHQVYCFGTDSGIESIKRKGIEVKSNYYGNFKTTPNYDLSDLNNLQYLFVTVKAPFLKDALKKVVPYIDPESITISLLNGLGHKEIIQNILGSKLVVGTIGAVEVSLDAVRAVDHRSNKAPHIDIASDFTILNKDLTKISQFVLDAGLSVEVSNSECEVIWKKLARLSAIATITSYTNLPLGLARSGEDSQKLLNSIVSELCKIAKLQKVDLSAVDVMNQIDNLPEKLTTSLQRDIQANLPSELECIIGEPIKLGKKLGVNTNSMEHCYSKIKQKVLNSL
jgi:2-dehydropantoate 2-reductase